MVVQGQWLDQSSFNQLPHFDTAQQHAVMVQQGFTCLPELLGASVARRTAALSKGDASSRGCVESLRVSEGKERESVLREGGRERERVCVCLCDVDAHNFL